VLLQIPHQFCTWDYVVWRHAVGISGSSNFVWLQGYHFGSNVISLESQRLGTKRKSVFHAEGGRAQADERALGEVEVVAKNLE
jgi:hypothetical protein